MTEYNDTPFPGDYQPGQVDTSPGFLGAFTNDNNSMPHFSPATSEHSFGVQPTPNTLDPSRPPTGSHTPAGPPALEVNVNNLGHPQPHSAGPTQGGFHPEHHHSQSAHSIHSGSGHSHSFSTASLPSLASSSTSFSIASHDGHPGGMYVPGFTPTTEFAPTPMFHPDGKLALNTNVPPQSLPPGVGLGIGVVPHTPLSGTLPPALLGRSPMTPGSAIMASQGFPPGMGKIGHDRNRSLSRPSPYHVNSRSNSLSLKSEGDEELLSIYSSTSTGSYQTTWSHGTNMITGDLGQMSLEHRRSSSTPFEIPSMNPAVRPRARSFSLGKASNSLDFLESELELAGPAAEREAQVRADLSTKAEQVRALSPCQHGKARAVWARRWLKLSYTPVNGFTVPRQGLYHSYTMSCNDFGLRPINSASFGKVVRSTFLGIRTRRLGVRGNSKYHYVSLRPAISTEAHRLNAYGDSSGQLHIAPQDGDFAHDDNSAGDQEILTEDDTEEDDDDDLGDLSESMFQGGSAFRSGSSKSRNRSRSASQEEGLMLRSARPAMQRVQVALANGQAGTMRMSSPGAGRPLPPFPAAPVGSDPSTVHFWSRFCQSQELLARCAAELQFDRYETNYRSFWETLSAESLQRCAQQPLASMIVDVMAMSFDHLILSLVDKILSPITPATHASLGLLAVNFEKMNVETMRILAPEIAVPVVDMSVQVGALLSRFLDLNQITTAINPILGNSDQLHAMRNSWQNLDTSFIIRQVKHACDCNEAVIESALAAFEAWLNEVGHDPCSHPVEQLAACVDNTLAAAEKAIRLPNLSSLIPRSSYISSQVMRLLTLRSDPSFGWFQLLKTWLDDYVAISCTRRDAFARDDPSFPPASSGQGHNTPNLAINTASAGYQAVPPLDNNAITPRPAFTSSGAATTATGPNVVGFAGQPQPMVPAGPGMQGPGGGTPPQPAIY